MTLHQFNIFVTVAKYQNLTKASKQLRLAQPGVSQQVRLLEENYGAKLFERKATGVELTRAGHHFLSVVEPILEEVRKLKTSSRQAAAMRSHPERLAVGGTHSTSSFLLPLLLSRFRKSHPRVEIDFRTNHGVEIERLLLKENIEIAVTTREPNSRQIKAEPYRREKMALVVARSHPLARAREVSWQDLERTPILIRSRNGRDGLVVSRLNSFMKDKGIKVTVGMRFESPNALKESVHRKTGIGILSQGSVRDNLKRGDLKALKVRGLKLELQTYIAYLQDKSLCKAAGEFLDLLRSSQEANVRKN